MTEATCRVRTRTLTDVFFFHIKVIQGQTDVRRAADAGAPLSSCTRHLLAHATFTRVSERLSLLLSPQLFNQPTINAEQGQKAANQTQSELQTHNKGSSRQSAAAAGHHRSVTKQPRTTMLVQSPDISQMMVCLPPTAHRQRPPALFIFPQRIRRHDSGLNKESKQKRFCSAEPASAKVTEIKR